MSCRVVFLFQALFSSCQFFHSCHLFCVASCHVNCEGVGVSVSRHQHPHTRVSLYDFIREERNSRERKTEAKCVIMSPYMMDCLGFRV